MLRIVGKTLDGKLVLSGVFKIYETEGIPLDIIFENLLEKDSIPSWTHFFNEAINANMKKDHILALLESTISDVYGIEFKNNIISVLKNL
jgi:alanyl-tRNA synthetase